MGLCVAPMAVSAQVTLSDKTSQKVDLGYGVEQSEFLTTAAATTITAGELRRTSAISLADALYGKLLGLNAYQNTGFKGEEGRGATFNIRGIQTTAKNGTQRLRYGSYEDIPFKFDYQTRNGEYGETFVPKYKLSDFVDLKEKKFK